MFTRTNLWAGKLRFLFRPTARSVGLLSPGALSLVWSKNQATRAIIQIYCPIIAEVVFITVLVSKVPILPGTALARSGWLQLLAPRTVDTEWVAALTSGPT